MLKAALLVYEQNNHIRVVKVSLNEEEKNSILRPYLFSLNTHFGRLNALLQCSSEVHCSYSAVQCSAVQCTAVQW